MLRNKQKPMFCRGGDRQKAGYFPEGSGRDSAHRKELDRRISTKDRRYVMLDLTEKGRKHFERIEKDMTDLFEKVLLGIPEEKRDQVMESIKLFNDACLEIEAAEKTK